jgi:hypothetical protein
MWVPVGQYVEPVLICHLLVYNVLTNPPGANVTREQTKTNVTVRAYRTSYEYLQSFVSQFYSTSQHIKIPTSNKLSPQNDLIFPERCVILYFSIWKYFL